MVPAYQTLIGHVLWLNVLQDTFVLKENVFQWFKTFVKMFSVQKDQYASSELVFLTLFQSILALLLSVQLIQSVNSELVFQLINALLSDVCKDITVWMVFAFLKLDFAVQLYVPLVLSVSMENVYLQLLTFVQQWNALLVHTVLVEFVFLKSSIFAQL